MKVVLRSHAVVLWLCALATAQAATVTTSLVLVQALINTNGCDTMMKTANGTLPGPEMRVKHGDELVVHVNNMLETPTTIHWHGVQPIDPWMDGSSGFSQCPIEPGASFTYRFIVNAKPGVYWYHGHNGFDVEQLFGAFIVDPSDDDEASAALAAQYDDELTMFISSWDGQPLGAKEALFSSPVDIPNGVAPVLVPPLSMAINGRGTPPPPREALPPLELYFAPYECNAEVPAPEVFTVTPGLTYKLNIINNDVVRHAVVKLEGHEMTVVRADGQPVQPLPTAAVDIYPGQRYEVLIDLDQEVDNYVLGVEYAGGLGLASVTAWVHYEGAPPIDGALPDIAAANITHTEFDLYALRGEEELPDALKGAAHHTLEVAWTQENLTEDGRIAWLFAADGAVTRPPEDGIALLQHVYEGTSDDLPPGVAPRYEFQAGEVVDFIIHARPNILRYANEVGFPGLPPTEGILIPHPMHMHGYAFYVLGWGPGTYDEAEAAASGAFNFDRPVRRDVQPMFVDGIPGMERPTDSFENAGWVRIRFQVSNSGVWLLHCHIVLHFSHGQGLAFVSAKDAIPEPPAEWTASCGNVGGDIGGTYGDPEGPGGYGV